MTNLSSQTAVTIKTTAVNMENMTTAIDTGYEKLMHAIAEQGTQLLGAPTVLT